MGDLGHKKDQVEGRLKNALGSVTDDDKKKAEGEAQKRKGKAGEAREDLGDAARKAKDALS